MGDREIMSRIKAAVEELATFEYPRVWIGEEGITPEEYLRMEEINVEERRELWQKMTPEARIKVWEEIPKEYKDRLPEEPPVRWEDLPEWLRADMRAPLDISPGEFVGIGGGEEDFGIQMPTISHRYLDGLWVLRNMPGEVHPNDLAELEHEVSIIRAAKEGTVIVKVASNVRFAKEDELSEEDRLFITAAFTTAAGDTMAVVFEGYETAWLPLDALTEELVDDDLVEELEFFASGDKMMPSYVIEDSERARAALEKRLGS